MFYSKGNSLWYPEKYANQQRRGDFLFKSATPSTFLIRCESSCFRILAYKASSTLTQVRPKYLFKSSKPPIKRPSAVLSNTDWGSVSLGCPVARSSRSLGWFAPFPRASALVPAPPLRWTRSCWAYAQSVGVSAPRDPRWCPSPSPSRWNRRTSREGAGVSWREPAGGAGSRFDRRSAPPGRRGWGRGPNTHHRQRIVQPSPGGLL